MVFMLGGPALAQAVSPVTPSQTPAPSRHFRRFGHYRHSGRYGRRQSAPPESAAPADAAGGESFVKDGRRYYWFVQGGRRVYSSHPPAGYQPAFGPSPDGAGAGVPTSGGVADLDAPLSPSERAAQAARLRQAQAHLASLEQRIGRLRHLERLRVHPARPVKKHR